MDEEEVQQVNPELPEAEPEAPAEETPVQVQEIPAAPRRHPVLKTVLGITLAAAVTAGACGFTASAINSRWQQRTDAMEQSFAKKIAQLEQELAGKADVEINHGGTSLSGTGAVPLSGMTPGQVYAANVSCVVAISNHSTTTNVYGQVSNTASAGTGFILTEDGYVVTNYHVVENASTLTVITYDNTEYDAEIVGFDSTNDVALLKVEAEGLQAAVIGSSDDLIVGDQVVAIGNPLGELTSTLTVGYISAKDRTINTDGTRINMMQTDAAINAGNSGGPLFNMLGQVVGITTAKYSGATSSGATIEGIGFAIPIDDVVGMVQDLKDFGYVTGAYLGVSVRTMDSEVSTMYGLPMGSYVESVEEGGCAQRGGVQPKDIILAVGEYPVASNTDLTRALRKFKAGDETTVTVYRAGQRLTLPVVLDSKPKPVVQNAPDDTKLPQNGSFEEWFNYFSPYFGQGAG